nr:GNAT family N-acetyltransferase [Anaeromonas frigoriresistens]
MTHALTFFAHDRRNIETWTWQGFGFRCVDAIRKAEVIDVYNSSIKVKKANVPDISNIVEIHREHIKYYKKSPIFFPKNEEDPSRDLINWLSKDNHHLWIAYTENKAIGYMMLEPTGETYISEHKNIMNITGAYTTEEERGSKAGAMILNNIQKWLIDNDYPLCGVDFESINNLGSYFWTKYFTPYTYSLVRRIDERVLDIN